LKNQVKFAEGVMEYWIDEGGYAAVMYCSVNQFLFPGFLLDYVNDPYKI